MKGLAMRYLTEEDEQWVEEDLANCTAMNTRPRLRVMRDSDPITGQVWVMDETGRTWASFAIRHPDSGEMMASRNLDEARWFIDSLRMGWMCRAIDREAGI